jgi:hypothetical protein
MRTVCRRALVFLAMPVVLLGMLPACLGLALLLYVRAVVMLALALGEQVPRRWSPLGPRWRAGRRAA